MATQYRAATDCTVQGVAYKGGETIDPSKHNLDSLGPNNVRCGLFEIVPAAAPKAKPKPKAKPPATGDKEKEKSD